MSQTTHPRVPPTLRPSSREDLERRRQGVLATGPSGTVYRIRKVNLARSAEAGFLPSSLKTLAQAAIRAQMTGDADGMPDVDFDQLEAARAEERTVNDRLVLATVIDPPLTVEDLGTGELADDPVLPAVDYEWLVKVARGEASRDFEGRPLFGPDPVAILETFQHHHGCNDGCPHCAAVDEEFFRQERRRQGAG